MALFGNFTSCNMMTGAGFDSGFLGGFAMAWLGVVMLFFICALARRWIGEEIGAPFSLIGGLVGSILPYFIVVFLTCSYKWGLVIGLIGGVIGAFFIGNFVGENIGF